MKRTFFSVISLFFFLTSYAWCVDTRFSSFIEHAPNGKIDWHNGYFYGIGIGYPHLNYGSKARALRVAQAGALSSILQVASGLRVDDRHTLADMEKEKLIIQIKGLVHYEPWERKFIKKGDHPFFRVVYRAPMTGVEGLTQRLLNQLRTKSSSWQDIPKPGSLDISEEKSAPWLVLDARGLEKQSRVNPALFPKIVTEKGETLYEVKSVDETALMKRGMARYVVSDMSQEELVLCPARRPLARLMDLVFPGAAYAQERQKRKKRGRYIIKDVQQVQGLMQTNVVISEVDAKSIQKEDASNQILKKCRVIVIVSSSIGGIEGKIIKHLALCR